jgi:hypothetical protein
MGTSAGLGIRSLGKMIGGWRERGLGREMVPGFIDLRGGTVDPGDIKLAAEILQTTPQALTCHAVAH